MIKCLDLGQSSTMVLTGKLNSKQRHDRKEMAPKYCRVRKYLVFQKIAQLKPVCHSATNTPVT